MTAVTLAPVDLFVDLDLSVRRGAGAARLRARHALRGTTVLTVATAGTGTAEIGRCDVSEWQTQLARACRVRVPGGSRPGPADGLALPWDLMVGTGAALAQHRPDLYDVLVARAAGQVTAGRHTLSTDASHEQIRRLHHSVVGRLRLVGTVPQRGRVGWLCWLLFGDGWRALTPYVATTPDGPRPMVRLDPRTPDDLAEGPARWAMEVAR
jgi:hypothetical protein